MGRVGILGPGRELAKGDLGSPQLCPSDIAAFKGFTEPRSGHCSRGCRVE